MLFQHNSTHVNGRCRGCAAVPLQVQLAQNIEYPEYSYESDFNTTVYWNEYTDTDTD
jgi:hypothetical protein